MIYHFKTNNMEQVNNSIAIQEIINYILLVLLLAALFFGIRKVYIGVKQQNKWAKIAAKILIVLLVLLIIGGFIFYLYALALGEAFKN